MTGSLHLEGRQSPAALAARREAERRWDGVEVAPRSGPDSLPIAIGSALTADDVVVAYRRGLFPWPPGDDETQGRIEAELATHLPRGDVFVVEPCEAVDGFPIPWYSPPQRGVLEFSQVHVSKHLRRALRKAEWSTTADRAFDEVIERCAMRDGSESWITPHFRRTYCELHRRGYAHSVEVWEGDELVGGVFGVASGRVLTGEATFFLRSNASKIAILDLAARVLLAGGEFLDTQVLEPPLARLGATLIDRSRYLERLERARDQELRLEKGRRDPLSSLAVLAEAAGR